MIIWYLVPVEVKTALWFRTISMLIRNEIIWCVNKTNVIINTCHEHIFGMITVLLNAHDIITTKLQWLCKAILVHTGDTKISYLTSEWRHMVPWTVAPLYRAIAVRLKAIALEMLMKRIITMQLKMTHSKSTPLLRGPWVKISRIAQAFSNSATHFIRKFNLVHNRVWSKYNSMITSSKWKRFPRYWPFVQGLHRSPVNSRTKGALMFCLICAWING